MNEDRDFCRIAHIVYEPDLCLPVPPSIEADDDEMEFMKGRKMVVSERYWNRMVKCNHDLARTEVILGEKLDAMRLQRDCWRAGAVLATVCALAFVAAWWR